MAADKTNPTAEEQEFGEWWTAPAESESGELVMVTGRDDIARFRSNPRYNIRVEVTYPYGEGMPGADIAEQLGAITESIQHVLKKDPVAVLTGIFTGAGERNWVFYTTSTFIFQKKINEALDSFPLLPLAISAENDPDWEAYDEMSEARVDG